MPSADGEPVQVPPPPIPAGNQGANNLAVALGDQEGSWRVEGDQALDVIQAVRRACVLAPRLGPELQDRLCVLAPTPTYRDSLASQTGSMAIRTRGPLAGPSRRVGKGQGALADSVCFVVSAFDRQRAERPVFLHSPFFDFPVEEEVRDFSGARFERHCHARDRFIEFGFFA